MLKTPFNQLPLIIVYHPTKQTQVSKLTKIHIGDSQWAVRNMTTVNAYCNWLRSKQRAYEIRKNATGEYLLKSFNVNDLQNR